MSLFDIIQSIDNTLEKNIKSYDNSFIDKFMDELKKHLAIADSMNKLKEFPKDTLFTLDRYESDYAVCENRTNGKMYDIPRFMVDSYAREGDILKLEGNIYRVDFKENEKQQEISRELTKQVFRNN